MLRNAEIDNETENKWFQTIDLPSRADLALSNFKSAVLFFCLTQEQKQNLFRKAYWENF